MPKKELRQHERTTLVWSIPKEHITSTEKMVLLALNNFADSTGGNCFPSAKTIAEDCCMARPTVSKALSKLAERGYITKSARYKDKMQTSNLYQINYDAISGVTQFYTAVTEDYRGCNGGLQGVSSRVTPGVTEDYTDQIQLTDPLTDPFNKESEQKNAVTKGTNKGALPSGSTSTENSQASKPLVHCPEKTEASGVTPTTPGKDQYSAPVRVKKTLGALQGGSNREYQKAMAERAALTLFQSEDEELSFYRWAKGRFDYNGEQQADIAIARLRNKAKATPRDKELLSQFRNSTSSPQQAPELTREERMALAAEEYKKDPSILKKDVTTFQRDHGVSVHNFKCYLFRVGLVG